jgi:hypothetical protein
MLKIYDFGFPSRCAAFLRTPLTFPAAGRLLRSSSTPTSVEQLAMPIGTLALAVTAIQTIVSYSLPRLLTVISIYQTPVLKSLLTSCLGHGD